MRERTTRRLAAGTGVVALALALANAALIVVGRRKLRNSDGDLPFSVLGTLGGLLLPAIGLLILVRARNVVGWFLVVSGVAHALGGIGTVYPAVGLVTHPGLLP